MVCTGNQQSPSSAFSAKEKKGQRELDVELGLNSTTEKANNTVEKWAKDLKRPEKKYR